jgi:hypothetical protein
MNSTNHQNTESYPPMFSKLTFAPQPPLDAMDKAENIQAKEEKKPEDIGMHKPDKVESDREFRKLNMIE